MTLTCIDDILLYILVVQLQVQLYQLYLYKYNKSTRYAHTKSKDSKRRHT